MLALVEPSSWCVRVGQPGREAVLVITDYPELLHSIAEVVVDLGFTVFVALPSVAADLQRCARFDLIVAYGDLAAPPVDQPATDAARVMRLIRERLSKLGEVVRLKHVI